MTIAIDLDTHLASNLTALAQQGVANTNNFAHYANLAFTKDRIWIAGYDDWQPTGWHEVPPRAVALEPAEASVLSAAEARAFVEGFNSQMLNGHMLDSHTRDGAKRLWAVALPVAVRYEGDPRAGDTVVGHRF